MHVVRALNPNDAWPQLIELVLREGQWQDTRAGRALVVPVPVATIYSRPWQRYLFDPLRDANPFFSLFEPLWMLAGRDDAAWLGRFVGDFSSRFAEANGRMHGAYGKRWRDWFVAENDDRDGAPERYHVIDQLDVVARLLRDNPQDRQAVIQMWDAEQDLGVPGLKDRPCNQQVLLRADRVVDSRVDMGNGNVEGSVDRYLDVTVTNRSNDLSWGLITANACQFSVLQEYLAARTGYEIGTYTQFSNNLHIYETAMEKVDYASAAQWIMSPHYPRNYPDGYPLVQDPETFDEELRTFMLDPSDNVLYRNTFFSNVARPMWMANEARRAKNYADAIGWVQYVGATDLRYVARAWLERRFAK